MYNRVMDNSKILKITGILKENLTSIHDGLELSDYFKLQEFIKPNYVINAGMDRITQSHIPMEKANIKEKLQYYCSYFGVYDFLRSVKGFIK